MTFQPIDTAPRNVTIDVLAKYWHYDTDTFAFRRFPNCRWSNGDSACNVKPYWVGLDHGWRAVGWMPIPLPIPPLTPDE
jgi:hypothetical protein